LGFFVPVTPAGAGDRVDPDTNLGGHDYVVQFTTDAPHWGGLSSCTIDEAISWSKESGNTKQVQRHVDATIALPNPSVIG